MMGFQRQNDPIWSGYLAEIKDDIDSIEKNFGKVDEQFRGIFGVPMEWPGTTMRSSKNGGQSMSSQDKHIETRIAGIEAKLDAQVEGIRESVARMQKGFDDADRRFERAFERHDAELALQRQKNDQSYQALYDLVDSNKKHASNMAAVTIFGTIGGVLAALALVVTLGAGWITEQGSYAKSYGETQVEIQRAADERAEFRESVKAIQDTQRAILERLPPATTD